MPKISYKITRGSYCSSFPYFVHEPCLLSPFPSSLSHSDTLSLFSPCPLPDSVLYFSYFDCSGTCNKIGVGGCLVPKITSLIPRIPEEYHWPWPIFYPPRYMFDLFMGLLYICRISTSWDEMVVIFMIFVLFVCYWRSWEYISLSLIYPGEEVKYQYTVYRHRLSALSTSTQLRLTDSVFIGKQLFQLLPGGWTRTRE